MRSVLAGSTPALVEHAVGPGGLSAPIVTALLLEATQLVLGHRRARHAMHARKCAGSSKGTTATCATRPRGLIVARHHWKAQRLNACHHNAGSNVCEHVELRRQHTILESHAYKRTLGRQKKVIALLGGGNTSRRRRWHNLMLAGPRRQAIHRLVSNTCVSSERVALGHDYVAIHFSCLPLLQSGCRHGHVRWGRRKRG